MCVRTCALSQLTTPKNKECTATQGSRRWCKGKACTVHEYASTRAARVTAPTSRPDSVLASAVNSGYAKYFMAHKQWQVATHAPHVHAAKTRGGQLQGRSLTHTRTHKSGHVRGAGVRTRGYTRCEQAGVHAMPHLHSAGGTCQTTTRQCVVVCEYNVARALAQARTQLRVAQLALR